MTRIVYDNPRTVGNHINWDIICMDCGQQAHKTDNYCVYCGAKFKGGLKE